MAGMPGSSGRAESAPPPGPLHSVALNPDRFGVWAGRYGVPQIRFGGRASGGNAGLATIKVGPPHVVGSSRRLAHRTDGKLGIGKLGIGMAEEVHDPRMWALPLGNHGGRPPWFSVLSSPSPRLSDSLAGCGEANTPVALAVQHCGGCSRPRKQRSARRPCAGGGRAGRPLPGGACGPSGFHSISTRPRSENGMPLSVLERAPCMSLATAFCLARRWGRPAHEAIDANGLDRAGRQPR